jgi:hypothetical protein
VHFNFCCALNLAEIFFKQRQKINLIFLKQTVLGFKEIYNRNVSLQNSLGVVCHDTLSGDNYFISRTIMSLKVIWMLKAVGKFVPRPLGQR